MIQVDHLREGFCGSSGNFHPAFPVQSGVCSKLAVQVGEEAELGHVIIHNQPFLALSTVSPQYQQVFVSHTAQNFHLHSELHLCLGAPHFQPLHCNLRQRSGVHFFVTSPLHTTQNLSKKIQRLYNNIQARTRPESFTIEIRQRNIAVFDRNEVWEAKVEELWPTLGSLIPKGSFSFPLIEMFVSAPIEDGDLPKPRFDYFCFSIEVADRHGHFPPKRRGSNLETKNSPQG